MSDVIEIDLTEGAIKNGYIRIPSDQTLIPEQHIAADERDSSVQTFSLMDDRGHTFQTCVLTNRGRLKQRFNAYFKERQIKPGHLVRIAAVAPGQYKMEFVMEQKTLLDYFNEYKANPRSDWMGKYHDFCEQGQAIFKQGIAGFDDEVLRGLWFEQANGVANVGLGFMYEREYEAVKALLPEVTFKIFENPAPEMLDEVIGWAKKQKSVGHLERVVWAVIYRVFATAAPHVYSSIVNDTMLRKIVTVFNERFGLSVPSSGNWAVRCSALMAAVRAQGLANEDAYLLNTFVWDLGERLTATTVESEASDSGVGEVEEGGYRAGPRNVIYYGPPGTGKTYALQQLLKRDYTESEETQSEQAFLIEQMQPMHWFEVIALVLLDTNRPMKVGEVVEHRFYQAKAQANGRNGNLRATAWSYLQTYTVADSKTVNHTRRAEPAVFDKREDSTWFIVDSERELLAEYEDRLQGLRAGPQGGREIHRYEFVTFHQSYGYEEFVEGLRPLLGEEESEQVRYEIRQGSFLRLCERARMDPNNAYAMVIDEINRGNISKIFGELITLIETDKREGMAEAISATLPYSQVSFSVPRNVDLIGTMNTADRSLALVDTALRRRFDFVERAPDPAVLEGVNVSVNDSTIDVATMLATINRRIEVLYDRDHTIGHAYFTPLAKANDKFKALGDIFAQKIIPLLEEYFFEDWGKIRLVLGDNRKPAEQQFIREAAMESVLEELFGSEHELEPEGVQRHFVRNHAALANPQAYIGIYQAS